MKNPKLHKLTSKRKITRDQLARVIYRTMKIERHEMSHIMAKELARKIRLPKPL